jgi:hypothetical protein
VDTVRQVAANLTAEQRSRTVILTANYGEGGALARARRSNPADAAALPPVYSGHNAFADWGIPPESADSAILVGDFDVEALDQWFTGCETVAALTSPPGVDNEEAGAPVRLCTGPTQPWTARWPAIRHLG